MNLPYILSAKRNVYTQLVFENFMDKIKLLLADDHEIMREGIRRLLEDEGDIVMVAEADTGEHAYQLYFEILPDVVIMDLSMPGVGGLNTIKKILAKDKAARCIVLSAHDSPVYVRRALDAGALGFVSKQYGQKVLVNTVRVVATGKKYIEPRIAQQLALDTLGVANDPIETLSTREFELFLLLAQGHSVINIAKLLYISPKTVGTHQTHILEKLSVSNAAQLVHIAMQYGLLEKGTQ